MATRIPTAVRNAACDAVVDRLDAAATAGQIQIRTGLQPATADDAATGTLLATITLADPAFGAAGAVNAGEAVLSGVPLSAAAVADGTAGWFRAADGDGNTVLDGTVTASGGGGQIELNTVAITTGVQVEITAGTVTMPAG